MEPIIDILPENIEINKLYLNPKSMIFLFIETKYLSKALLTSKSYVILKILNCNLYLI